jgi:hypothetical protein
MFRLFLIFSLSILLLCQVYITAQRQDADSIRSKENAKADTFPVTAAEDTSFTASTSPFAEFLGKGFFSLNVDFRLKKHFAISLGFQPLEVVCPDIMFYYLSGEKNSLEIGGGFSTAMTNNWDVGGILLHGVIGYRYQKKKGFFFRAGLTPIYIIPVGSKNLEKRLLPFPGVSLGYSF